MAITEGNAVRESTKRETIERLAYLPKASARQRTAAVQRVYYDHPIPLIVSGGGSLMVNALGLFEYGIRFEWVRDRIDRSFESDTFQAIADVLDLLSVVASIPGCKSAHDLLALHQIYLAQADRKDTKFQDYHRGLAIAELDQAHGLIQAALNDLILSQPRTKVKTGSLLAGAEGMLGDKFQVLTKPEQDGFTEACRCLLGDAYTACEFLSLRTAESLLLRWYQRKKHKKLDDTWGAVLKALVDAYPVSKRPKELKLLDYLNERRIEVAHPKRLSTIGDAESTLFTVVNLVSDLLE